MVVSGVSGVLMKLNGSIGLVFGNSLRWVGRNFRSIQDFRWVTVQILVLGMTCSVGSSPLE
jgi:hypothetical protein